MIIKVFIICFLSSLSLACHPQFDKELRYLDLYLGIKPDNDGEIPQKDPEELASYVKSSSDLNCDYTEECLWKNAPTDDLLDTTDFWFFKKTDDKVFPYQIQPGAPDMKPGTNVLVAGNTTLTAESAVLFSAPIACQRGVGSLSFNYWLYNNAKIEVILIRASSRRKHLQTLNRPEMNCHFLRPAGDVCTVPMPAMSDPFRIAIRAYNLKDNVVGSMAMLNNISYTANVCAESPFPTLFSSKLLDGEGNEEILSVSDLDCDHPLSKCRWSNDESTLSQWRIGTNTHKWEQFIEDSETRPNGSFLVLAVDTLSPRPYAVLRSNIIPCTQRTTTLSLKYWLKSGTQIEICSVDEEGVQLSCAYLAEEDSPGPIEIDLDAFDRPFRFTFRLIAFDETAMGVAVLSDLRLSGLLCSEQPPPVSTTIDPPTIAHMFGLQRSPDTSDPYPLTLDCDFSKDYCKQWVNNDEHVSYGVVPRNSDHFPVPKTFKGNVAVFLLNNGSHSVLRSREVPCARNAGLLVTYLRSEKALVQVCARNQCVEGQRDSDTVLLPVHSLEPFEFTIEVSAFGPAVVAISNIKTEGDVCPLQTPAQYICNKLSCQFTNDLCNYMSSVEGPGDVPMTPGAEGATVTLNTEQPRAVLRSPRFDLLTPSIIAIEVTQTTFGSRLLICPNEASDSTACQELLGPRVSQVSRRRVMFPLEPSTTAFVLVLTHDLAAQLGPAHFVVHSVQVRTPDDQLLCN